MFVIFRNSVLRVAIGILIFAALLSTAQAGDWPMFMHDPAHTGESDEVVEPPLKLLWNYTTGGSIISSPAVSGGVVYVGSNDNNTYAFDAATGALKWKYMTGGWVSSSPAVSDGIVYVGSNDNNVYALDVTTGALKWKYALDYFISSCSPVVSGGIVYVGSFNDDLYALDAATGTLKWRFNEGGCSPAVSGGIVYVGSISKNKNIYALDATTGALKWNYATGDTVWSSPAVSGGVVYVGSDDNNTYALDAITGALRWKYTTGARVTSSPSISGGIVYVGSWDNHIYALDAATGALKWDYITGDIDPSPVISGSIVYVGSFDSNIYALDTVTGALKWKYMTGGPIWRSPAVSGRRVYVGSSDGNIYAFESNRINDCTVISSPGEYKLAADIINSTDDICIRITSSDVIFDGNGHTIDGIDDNTYGVYVYNPTDSLTNVTVKNLHVTDWYDGIYLNHSSNSMLINNMANSNNGIGIGLEYSSNNTLSGNNASNNSHGIALYDNSSNNTLNGNNASNNYYGIALYYSDSNTLLGNNASNNNIGIESTGIALFISNKNTLSDNRASNNIGGVYLSTSSNNILKDSNIKTNTIWDFISNYGSVNNEVVNLDINPKISFTGKDVAIKSSPSIIDDPSGYHNISKFINITNTSTDSWLFLNVSYSDSDIIGLNESTLRMWEYSNSGSWSLVPNSGVNIVQNYIYANTTSFSVFAPMGLEGVPPASITNLTNTSYDAKNIIWTWTDPSDIDFANVSVFIDGTFKANIPKGTELYTATGLVSDMWHTISTRTVDTNGNVNQTWVNHSAKTSVPEAPIVITITSPENGSTNRTGNITVTASLDRPGKDVYLNWDGVNESMNRTDATGMNYSENKTGLLSGNFSFKVYASDSKDIFNVSETRVVNVDRTIIIDLSNAIDNSTGNLSRDIPIPIPSDNSSGNATITLYKGTNVSIDCAAPKNISVNSWAKLESEIDPKFAANLFENYMSAGQNLSFSPDCTRFIPDAQIRFNFTNEQLAGANQNELKVKYYNNTMNTWEDVTIVDNKHANYIVANTSHFSMFVIVVPARSSPGGSYSSGGGGSGGMGVTTRESLENVEMFETKKGSLVRDLPVSYKFTPLDYGIYELIVTAKENQDDIYLRVERLKNLSRLINQSPSGTDYYYQNVWAGPAKIKESLIRFKVQNSWLTSNGLSHGDMKMLKWDGSKWVELSTIEIAEDDTHTYYEARSNSLSQLAVVGVKSAASTAAQEVKSDQKVATGPSTASQAESSAASSTASVPSGVAPPVGFAYILAVISMISVVTVLILVLQVRGYLKKITSENQKK